MVHDAILLCVLTILSIAKIMYT